ncbi:hypothetical protein [Martelella sp. AD-3]|uniref:hypothetical protein n=1 Tax=Martelella sp. AD-3 TaxID=686597 RepID=UPI0012689D5B|nr:hypothetical protein [Martelella sp. AD-3]
MRTMRAAVKVLCIVTAMLLGVLSPSVGSAATHCATMPEVAMHHAQPAGAPHDMDHRTDGAKACCLAACGLPTGIAPGQPSSLLTRVVRDLTFPDLSARLKGHPVPPDLEPPRLRA